MIPFLGRSKIGRLLLLGFIVHVLVLKAAFDIYFSSPIDHGMTPIKSTDNPPAKRLVLIVADGLRAEAIYSKGHVQRAPNLAKIRYTRGSWGIAHTRVPTESRPGHVALLGGIYEDPSAILSGWKKNPVEFDSVINQSTNAWCWGSPDIVNMFNRDNLPHIHVNTYDASIEDFGSKNTSELDLWVFDKVEEFINEQMLCDNCTDFEESGNLFFLHLLGIDTVGHGSKPDSPEYIKNIKVVDENIPRIEALFERAFPDNATAYIVTADHGMTNWGSHGAGSAHETETPIIAWGAGIKADAVRKDINQVDTAPLISSLLGINYPINSVGFLPYQYLETTVDNIADMLIANVKEFYEFFNIKRVRRMTNAVKFVPYPKMAYEEIQEKIELLEIYKMSGQYDVLRAECIALMNILIDAANYYHNYYQLPILMAISIGLISWIIYLASCNVHIVGYRVNYNFLVGVQMFGFIPAYFITHCLLYFQDLPLVYWFYFMFPIFMTQTVFKRHVYLLEALKLMKNFGLRYAVLYIMLFFVGARLLVFGFHNRTAYSIIMFVMAFLVLALKNLEEFSTEPEKSVWIATCVSMSLFPFLPVMKTSFQPGTYLCGHFVWWAFVSTLIDNLSEIPHHTCDHIIVLKRQLTILKYTPLIMMFNECNLISSDSPIKYLTWLWAAYPIYLIPYCCDFVMVRAASIFAGFVPFYMLVTANYEGIFLALYAAFLNTWLTIEGRSFNIDRLYRARFSDRFTVLHNQTIDDFRRGFFFVIMIFIGFFGTGNIASLNSFDPMWVRCFMTVFSPFKMAGLILLKIMVPFIFTTCVYQGINVYRRGDIQKMFCIILMTSDVMIIELLFSITNIGSWLQIGMSLSHFIIMESFVFIILVIYGIAWWLNSTQFSPTEPIITANDDVGVNNLADHPSQLGRPEPQLLEDEDVEMREYN